MAKRPKPEEIVAKLRQANVLISQGQSVAEAIRAIGVTEVTHYRWRKEHGGIKSGQVRRVKDPEAENARLRKAIADLTLNKLILQAASHRDKPQASDPASELLSKACYGRGISRYWRILG